MKDSKKVSIITICYNEVDAIAFTLNSVINQQYKNYEWIVIDGNSSDGTNRILDQYKSSFNHYLSEQDDGIYDAMNKGIDLASGEYLFFLNGGDLFHSSSVLMDVFSRSISGDIVYGDINIISENGSKIYTMPTNPTKEFLLRKTIPHQATFSRRILFDKIGRFDTKYKIAGDFKFSLQAIFKHKCKIQYVPVIISDFNGLGVGSLNSVLRQSEKERARKEVLGVGIDDVNLKAMCHVNRMTFHPIKKRIINKIKSLMG